jgi:hypothetical protein
MTGMRWRLGLGPAVAVALLLAVSSAPTFVQGEISLLDLDEDSRTAFSVETFAFLEHGRIQIHVRNYSLYVDDKLAPDVQWGIMLRSVRSKADGPAKLAVESTRVLDDCSLIEARASNPDLVLLLSDPTATAATPATAATAAAPASGDARRQLHWGFGEGHEHEMNSITFSHNFTAATAGRYDIEMIVCLPSDKRSSDVELSAVVQTVCFNVEGGKRNYLSAGETSLPALYGALAVAFLFAVVAWIVVLASRGGNALLLHIIMLVLILFKVTSLAAYAVHLFFVSLLGQTLTVVGWDVVYFAFSFLNGGAMFVIILLLGSGWSYIKPKLSQRENNTLTAVVVLQVIANVARVFVGESSPGSMGFVRWSDILAIVDVACCALVIFPIIWSIHKVRACVCACVWMCVHFVSAVCVPAHRANHSCVSCRPAPQHPDDDNVLLVFGRARSRGVAITLRACCRRIILHPAPAQEHHGRGAGGRAWCNSGRR